MLVHSLSGDRWVFVLRLVTSSLKLEVGVGMVRVTRLPPSGRNTCVVSRFSPWTLGFLGVSGSVYTWIKWNVNS